MLGHGRDIAGVKVSESEQTIGTDGNSTTARSDRSMLDAPSGTVSLSTSSSTTTISRTSTHPPAEIRVSSVPPYDPIDTGDEGRLDEEGQQDRRDGRLDEVFKLHSSRRMKPTSNGRGVSIPSRKSSMPHRAECRTSMVPLHPPAFHRSSPTILPTPDTLSDPPRLSHSPSPPTIRLAETPRLAGREFRRLRSRLGQCGAIR